MVVLEDVLDAARMTHEVGSTGKRESNDVSLPSCIGNQLDGIAAPQRNMTGNRDFAGCGGRLSSDHSAIL
jgi:hypothetical protein